MEQDRQGKQKIETITLSMKYRGEYNTVPDYEEILVKMLNRDLVDQKWLA